MTNFSFKEAADMDKILNLIKNHPNNGFNSYGIQEELFPNKQKGYVDKLLRQMKEIASYSANYQITKDSIFIDANSETEYFLQEGGFLGITKSSINNKIKSNEVTRLKEENLHLENENLKLNNIIADRDIKHGWIKIIQDYTWLFALFFAGLGSLITFIVLYIIASSQH